VIEVAARFLKAHKTAVKAVAIKLLAAKTMFAVFEIEPNDGVRRTMQLRMIFVSK